MKRFDGISKNLRSIGLLLNDKHIASSPCVGVMVLENQSYSELLLHERSISAYA